MTFPRADKDLLMFLASSSTAPSAPVLLTYTIFQDVTKCIFKKYLQHLRENLCNLPTCKSVPLTLQGTRKQTLSQTLSLIHHQFLIQNSVSEDISHVFN